MTARMHRGYGAARRGTPPANTERKETPVYIGIGAIILIIILVILLT
jgi:hypothetical protein